MAVALHHHGLSFERRVLSTFAHFDELLAKHPLGKVPFVEFPGGAWLFDSRSIIEHIETGAAPDARLCGNEENQRFQVLRFEAVGIALAEKVYERGIEINRKPDGQPDPAWTERLETQVVSSLRWLDQHAAEGHLVGDSLTRADLAVVTAATYALEKLPRLYDRADCKQLETYRAHAEARDVFSRAAYSSQEAAQSGWRAEN